VQGWQIDEDNAGLAQLDIRVPSVPINITKVNSWYAQLRVLRLFLGLNLDATPYQIPLTAYRGDRFNAYDSGFGQWGLTSPSLFFLLPSLFPLYRYQHQINATDQTTSH